MASESPPAYFVRFSSVARLVLVPVPHGLPPAAWYFALFVAVRDRSSTLPLVEHRLS